RAGRHVLGAAAGLGRRGPRELHTRRRRRRFHRGRARAHRAWRLARVGASGERARTRRVAGGTAGVEAAGGGAALNFMTGRGTTETRKRGNAETRTLWRRDTKARKHGNAE